MHGIKLELITTAGSMENIRLLVAVNTYSILQSIHLLCTLKAEAEGIEDDGWKATKRIAPLEA